MRETRVEWKAQILSCKPRGVREGLGTGQSGGHSDIWPEATQGPWVSPPISLQINDLRSQKTPIESLFIEATEKFRSNLKTMYSVPVRVAPSPRGNWQSLSLPQGAPQSLCPEGSHLPSPQNGKIHVGYKDLMENYQIVVSNLAAERGEKDTNLVLNLFQSLLDEFTRGHSKNDFELPKVGGGTAWGAAWRRGYPRGPHRPAFVLPHSRAKLKRRSGSRSVR